MSPRTEAGRALQAEYRELGEAFHQAGSLRDHADPKDKTGWNLHDIESCEDPYCLDALSGGDAILAIEREAVAAYAARLREAVDALESVCHSRSGLMCEHVGPEDPQDPDARYCNVHIERAAVIDLIEREKP